MAESAHQAGRTERKKLIGRMHELPLTRQAELLGISRGSVCALPSSVLAADLRLVPGMVIKPPCRKPNTSSRHPGHAVYPYERMASSFLRVQRNRLGEPVTTYAISPSWQRYRQLLLEAFDLSIQHVPIERWLTVRGHELHLDEWLPVGQPKGTLILVHGAGGNGRILAPLGDFAAELGWRALAPDLPGYGLTRPAIDFQWDYAEWPAAVACLADDCDGPVVLMGLSVGGMTAALAAQAARGVQGVIATTLLDMGDPLTFARAARWRWLGEASLLGFRWMPWVVDRLRLPLRLAAPMNRMSSHAAMAEYFASDPLLGGLRVPSRFFRTMHALKMPRIEPRCPLLLVHPGADRWTPTVMSRPAFDRVVGNKRLRELSGGSHLPAERPARIELEQEVAGFLAAVIRGGQSAA